MAHEANQRHVAIGIETTHENVNATVTSRSIDLHVSDVTELNSVLEGIREMSSRNSDPKVWPHSGNDEAVAVRL